MESVNNNYRLRSEKVSVCVRWACVCQLVISHLEELADRITVTLSLDREGELVVAPIRTDSYKVGEEVNKK